MTLKCRRARGAHGAHARGRRRYSSAKLDRICGGAIDNHGSSSQVSTWILEEVLQVPIKPPTMPKVVTLLEFLHARGGLRRDVGGELKARCVASIESGSSYRPKVETTVGTA